MQPWTTQINSKQTEIDIAQSERDTLSEKAEAIKNTRKEAQENLQQLQTEHQEKVIRKLLYRSMTNLVTIEIL